MLKKRVIFTSPLITALVMLSACQSLPRYQGQAIGPTTTDSVVENGYEQAGYLDAQDFLGADWMQSELHTVDPRAYNDGYANSYKITTPKHVYVVQGTQTVKKRIREIAAIETLRHTPTISAATKAVKDKTINLVETPLRAIKGGRNRYNTAKSTDDKLMMVSSGFAGVASKLGHGLKELGVTGLRITTSAAGAKCSGFGCATKAGEDIWSGLNSILGKHDAARRIHQRLGTDPASENKVLQKHVSRLAYADSYTGAAYKFGLAGAGIPVFSPVVKGVGYYNNVEFVAQYEDAHTRQTAEKTLMKTWGIDAEIINTLYSNKAFTNTSRTRLVMILGEMGNPDMRARLTQSAADSKTRYTAESQLAIYQYLATLDQTGVISGYLLNAPMVIAVRENNTLILPFATDYIRWTEDIAGPVQAFSQLTGNDTTFAKAQIHILGNASPRFRQEAQSLGVELIEITP